MQEVAVVLQTDREWATCMKFLHNFADLPWAGGTLLDPDLKVRISTGRWEPDLPFRGGSTRLEMHFDPEIRADRLTMPPPAKLLETLAAFRNEPPTEVVFESSASRKIAELILYIDSFENEVALIHTGPERNPSFASTATLISRAGAGILSENPYAALLYLLEAAPMLREWERDYAARWGAKRVGVYIREALAAELATETEVSVFAEINDLVGIARREIEA